MQVVRVGQDDVAVRLDPLAGLERGVAVAGVHCDVGDSGSLQERGNRGELVLRQCLGGGQI